MRSNPRKRYLKFDQAYSIPQHSPPSLPHHYDGPDPRLNPDTILKKLFDGLQDNRKRNTFYNERNEGLVHTWSAPRQNMFYRNRRDQFGSRWTRQRNHLPEIRPEDLAFALQKTFAEMSLTNPDQIEWRHRSAPQGPQEELTLTPNSENEQPWRKGEREITKNGKVTVDTDGWYHYPKEKILEEQALMVKLRNAKGRGNGVNSQRKEDSTLR